MTHHHKAKVPRYVATKCLQIANLASPWLASSGVLMFIDHGNSRGAAVGYALFALAICVIAIWFALVEREEDNIIEEAHDFLSRVGSGKPPDLVSDSQKQQEQQKKAV